MKSKIKSMILLLILSGIGIISCSELYDDQLEFITSENSRFIQPYAPRKNYTYPGEQVIISGEEFLINTITEGSQKYPDITHLYDGGFVVVWQSFRQDGLLDEIYGQQYDFRGHKLGPEFRVNTTSEGFQINPAITGLKYGGFIVTWNHKGINDQGNKIRAKRYDIHGYASEDDILVSDQVIGGYGEYRSSVTGLSDGGYVIVWEGDELDGSGRGVMGQRFDSWGIKRGDAFQVNTFNDGYQAHPHVAKIKKGGYEEIKKLILRDSILFKFF